jgi:predicted transcriptional regulator
MTYRNPPPPAGSLWAAPLARRTDPATSKAAAAAIVPKLGELQRAVLEAVRLYPGRTRNELARIHDWHPSEVSKRLPELERQGLVTRGPERVCTATGRACATWTATERARGEA